MAMTDQPPFAAQPAASSSSREDTAPSTREDPSPVTQEDASARLRVAMGDAALGRLADATVMVIGLGGVGASCAEALARGGVGRLVLIDRDVVAPSNINRQALAFTSTVGRPKTEVMAQMVTQISPSCEVTTLHAFLEKETVAEQLDALPRPDYVIDAIDTISQKLRIAAWCQEHQIPELASAGGANKLDPTRLAFAPIERTRNCPICKILRKECRRRGIRKLRVLYSDELPMRPRTNALTPAPRADGSYAPEDRGAVLGTMSYLPPIMGHMLAGRCICDLAGLINEQDPHPW